MTCSEVLHTLLRRGTMHMRRTCRMHGSEGDVRVRRARLRVRSAKLDAWERRRAAGARRLVLLVQRMFVRSLDARGRYSNPTRAGAGTERSPECSESGWWTAWDADAASRRVVALSLSKYVIAIVLSLIGFVFLFFLPLFLFFALSAKRGEPHIKAWENADWGM